MENYSTIGKEHIMADDRNAPATKGDIEDLRGEIKESAAMLRSEMQHTRDELIARMTDSDTRLLKAFYSFAESNQTRVFGTEQQTAFLKERLAKLESRRMEVERRLNMPPAA